MSQSSPLEIDDGAVSPFETDVVGLRQAAAPSGALPNSPPDELDPLIAFVISEPSCVTHHGVSATSQSQANPSHIQNAVGKLQQKLLDGVDMVAALRTLYQLHLNTQSVTGAATAAAVAATTTSSIDLTAVGTIMDAIEDAFRFSLGVLQGKILSHEQGQNSSNDQPPQPSNYSGASSEASMNSRRFSVLDAGHAGYDNVPDASVGQWLNDNFAQVVRKKRTGFNAPAGSKPGAAPTRIVVGGGAGKGKKRRTAEEGGEERRSSVLHVEESNPQSSGPGHTEELAPAAAEPNAHGNDSDHPSSAVTDISSGHGDVDEAAIRPPTVPKVDAVKTVTFTRKTCRPYTAANSNMVVGTMLKHCKVPMLMEIDSPDCNIFALHERFGERLLFVVALNVFSRYTFMTGLNIDLSKFCHFVQQVRRFYRDENPYHNQIHAADVLQTVHIFLLVNDMRENFSDTELMALLFSAMVHDMGHLGVGNAFLYKIRHPLSRVFNNMSSLESGHALSALYLLETAGCNFFVPPDDVETMVNREMYDDFKSLVVDCILGTDMKVHADHTRMIQGMLADGVIDDLEIASLLRTIVHVADIANPMKPFDTYVKWVERVLAEFWMQGDQEAARGLPISLLCDRNTTSLGKAQAGFINFVVKPFIDEMTEVMPSLWLERLTENASRMAQMLPDEEALILERVRQNTLNRQWVDCDRESRHTILFVVSRTTKVASDDHFQQPKEFPTCSDIDDEVQEQKSSMIGHSSLSFSASSSSAAPHASQAVLSPKPPTSHVVGATGHTYSGGSPRDPCAARYSELPSASNPRSLLPPQQQQKGRSLRDVVPTPLWMQQVITPRAPAAQ